MSKFKPDMSVGRAQMEKIIWATTSKDFKSTTGGVKSIMYVDERGATVLGPLSGVPEKILKDKYQLSAKIWHRRKTQPYQVYRGSESTSSDGVLVEQVAGRDAADAAVKRLNAHRAKGDRDTIYFHASREDYE